MKIRMNPFDYRNQSRSRTASPEDPQHSYVTPKSHMACGDNNWRMRNGDDTRYAGISNFRSMNKKQNTLERPGLQRNIANPRNKQYSNMQHRSSPSLRNEDSSSSSSSSLSGNGSPSSLSHEYSRTASRRSQHVVETIQKKIAPMIKDTRLQPNWNGIRLLRSEDVIPCEPSQSLLGIGTFSQVTRVILKGNVKQGKKSKKYACKQLKRDGFFGLEEYYKAATEIAYEAQILTCLDHPNIIQLRGLPWDGVASFANVAGEAIPDHQEQIAPPATSFFLIMDILAETLDQRIERWMTIDQPRDRIDFHQRNIEKLSLCKQLAAALEYIHSKGIVYRDLKPQNVGFCEERGNLKLFDFGLCRELPASKTSRSSSIPDEHERFHLSGLVGTMRYMAPEVCLSQPYNRDCDIYSWSIVAWEILSQAIPFETLNPGQYVDLVCRQGMRPTNFPLQAKRRRGGRIGEQPAFYNAVTPVPHELKVLLKQAWKAEPDHRIRFPKIQAQLDLFRELEELRIEEERMKGDSGSLSDSQEFDDFQTESPNSHTEESTRQEVSSPSLLDFAMHSPLPQSPTESTTNHPSDEAQPMPQQENNQNTSCVEEEGEEPKLISPDQVVQKTVRVEDISSGLHPRVYVMDDE